MALRHVPLVCALAACTLTAQVAVREDKATFSVRDEGALDPNPAFSFFARGYFPDYPYPIHLPAGNATHPREFRVIVLENEYLSCRVVPDLGGRLADCTDKSTGRGIFYSPIGIESSFPVADRRVRRSPADFAWSNKDGVATVTVEDRDRVSGMQWRVDFILRQGSAVLEQRVTLHNGSAARRGYEWLASAAIEADDPHLRFVYPARWMVGDDGTMTSWPLNAGRVDLSDLANDKGPTGLFAYKSREPWMAVYKPKFRAGVAHYGDPNQLPGRKLRIQDQAGYVEMQAGLFDRPGDFAYLIPEASRTFTHYWIPFHDLGGVARVTPYAVLNLARRGVGVTVELQATHVMKGARIRFSQANGNVFSETTVDLDPKTVWSKTLNAPARVDVFDASGNTILHQVETEYDGLPFDRNAPNPEPVRPSAKGTTESAYLERGLFDEQREQLAGAWGEYLAGIAKFPSNRPLLEAAGRLAFTLNRFDDAVKLLTPLVSGILPNAADEYYYGVARAQTGALEKAARDPVWRPAARLQLALLAARAHTMNAADSSEGGIEIALLRRAGKADAAKQRLEFWSERDPANLMIRFERVLTTNRDDADLWERLAATPEKALDLADRYLEMGAADDALKLLDRPYPKENPLIAYYRGYCRSLLGKSPAADFRAAASLSTRDVFPHGATAFAVLKAAVAADNSDAVAHDLLGDLYFNSLDVDRAITEWKRAMALKPDLPALARNLGRALLDVEGDSAAARPVLAEAARLNPDDKDIADALKRAESGAIQTRLFALHVTAASMAAPAPAHPQPRTEAPKAGTASAAPATPAASGDVATTALIRSVAQPDQAAAMFTAENFPKDRQPEPVRRAYIEAQFQRVVAMAQANRCADALMALETLGDEDKNLPFTLYGFGSFMKAPHFIYYKGAVQAGCGEEREARKTWNKLPKPEEAIRSADDVFPWIALLDTATADAKQKIAAEAENVKNRIAAGESGPDLVYAEGMLLIASGQRNEGTALLEQSAKSSEAMVQYLSLVALRALPQLPKR